MEIVCLSGFMGCGKSSVGKELRDMIDCEFVDLDDYIEAVADKTISQIFDESGEDGFRQIESAALEEIFEMSSNEDGLLVLSLGGGTLTTPKNVLAIHENATCVYLKASIDTLVENLLLVGYQNRPMLNGIKPSSERPMLNGIKPSSVPEVYPYAQRPAKPYLTDAPTEPTGEEALLRGRIEELMAQRSDIYESAATHILPIDGLSTSAIASSLKSLINR